MCRITSTIYVYCKRPHLTHAGHQEIPDIEPPLSGIAFRDSSRHPWLRLLTMKRMYRPPHYGLRHGQWSQAVINVTSTHQCQKMPPGRTGTSLFTHCFVLSVLKTSPGYRRDRLMWVCDTSATGGVDASLLSENRSSSSHLLRSEWEDNYQPQDRYLAMPRMEELLPSPYSSNRGRQLLLYTTRSIWFSQFVNYCSLTELRLKVHRYAKFLKDFS